MSYLLDTNVWSELRNRRRGDAHVRSWAEAVREDELFLSVVTVYELELGVQLMERRDARQGARLRTWLEERVLAPFARRVLPFDLAIARRCAALHVPDRRPERDAMIAATALVHGLTVVTRNRVDFDPMGVAVLDPWQSPGD
ncbi:type II toxin-antitoxin system VapC family toxin [Marinibaculum pumilum]|uniref:Ribonuclease VapC n=1 Tax=Marinibaculum pumilum TaxID=1766165 RepID=A0ABV7KZ91_9PROT